MLLQHRSLDAQDSHNALKGVVAGLVGLVLSAATAMATNVAVIDAGSFAPGVGQFWCNLLIRSGNSCTLVPASGPTGSLSGFDVVIDLSSDWADPNGTLGAYVAGGGGVVLWAVAPITLGVQTDPTVQDWIGANGFGSCDGHVLVGEAAPILPGKTIGTTLTVCSSVSCIGLADTTGHPDAVVVGPCEFGNSILLLRNTWQAGRSVFLQNEFFPSNDGGFLDDEIIINAVRWSAGETDIPTTSTWSLIALTLLLASAGTVLVRRRVYRAMVMATKR